MSSPASSKSLPAVLSETVRGVEAQFFSFQLCLTLSSCNGLLQWVAGMSVIHNCRRVGVLRSNSACMRGHLFFSLFTGQPATQHDVAPPPGPPPAVLQTSQRRCLLSVLWNAARPPSQTRTPAACQPAAKGEGGGWSLVVSQTLSHPRRACCEQASVCVIWASC